MGIPSLIKQVEWAFQTLDCLRQRKYELKKAGIKPVGVYSGGTMKDYIAKCCTFVKWAQKEYAIKYLVELRHNMGRMYIQKLINEKKSVSTIKSTVSALRKLEVAVKARYNCTIKLLPKAFSLPARRLRDRIDRFAYPPDQVQAIIAKAREINTQAADAIELGHRFGLRISCVLDLRTKDVLLNKMKLIVFQGKGGKQREVLFNSREDVWFLVDLVKGKKDMDLLFPDLKKSRLQYIMRWACKNAGIRVHKFHNLRHSYVEEQMNMNLELGMTDYESRKAASKDTGHVRSSVTYHYAVPRIRPGWRN